MTATRTERGASRASLTATWPAGARRCVEAARLPETGHKTVAHRIRVVAPARMMRHDALLAADPVEDRDPPADHENHCDDVGFLKVVADITEHVAKVNRMADEPVRSSYRQTAQGGPDPKPPSENRQTHETQDGAAHDQDLSL